MRKGSRGVRLPCLKTSGDFAAIHVKLLHIWLLSINPYVYLSIHSNSINDPVDTLENIVITGVLQVSLKY